ncbi:unnamed protein product, partial [Chrysoparadoxa australica]
MHSCNSRPLLSRGEQRGMSAVSSLGSRSRRVSVSSSRKRPCSKGLGLGLLDDAPIPSISYIKEDLLSQLSEESLDYVDDPSQKDEQQSQPEHCCQLGDAEVPATVDQGTDGGLDSLNSMSTREPSVQEKILLDPARAPQLATRHVAFNSFRQPPDPSQPVYPGYEYQPQRRPLTVASVYELGHPLIRTANPGLPNIDQHLQ